MENICIRLDSALSKRIEKDMREFNYSTKTDFVRDAIRVKLRELDLEKGKKKAWQALYSARGSLKGKANSEFRDITEEAAEELIDKKVRKHIEKKFGISLK